MTRPAPGADILSRYPKSRAELPHAYQAIYEEHYKLNRGGEYKTTSLSQRLEAWMHRKVAEDTQEGSGPTLEIGAGTLNHLRFEPSSGPYDVVEPFRELYEGSPLLERVRRAYADVDEIEPDHSYARVISIATYEHILDLPHVVARSAALLAPGGCARIAIPNEGTLLWGLGTMVTGFEFRRRYGLDYRVLMAYEHVSTADEIEAVLATYFTGLRREVLGLGRGFAFYRFYVCTGPRVDVARADLASWAGLT